MFRRDSWCQLWGGMSGSFVGMPAKQGWTLGMASFLALVCQSKAKQAARPPKQLITFNDLSWTTESQLLTWNVEKHARNPWQKMTNSDEIWNLGWNMRSTLFTLFIISVCTRANWPGRKKLFPFLVFSGRAAPSPYRGRKFPTAPLQSDPRAEEEVRLCLDEDQLPLRKGPSFGRLSFGGLQRVFW